MTTKPLKYYEDYEERYCRVYAQGVECWAGNPDEIATVIREVDEFFAYAGITSSDSIIEFGCGEGFIGEHLLSKGYSYLGIDLSPSALDKARRRLRGDKSRFVIGDVTNLFEVQSDSFSVGIDNHCLHMLITDDDRDKYLSEVHRVLKPGGYVWFCEIGQENPFEEKIASLEEFLIAHPIDFGTYEAREAYTSGRKTTVFLPRLPARFNNCDGYRMEVERAGFVVDLLAEKKNGIVIYARKKDRSRKRATLK